MIDENTAAVLNTFRQLLPDNLLLVGIGNSLKTDDGIGPEICTQLKEFIPDNVIDAGSVPENYIQVIIKKAPKVLLFIDAIDFGASPGTIQLFEPTELSTGGVTTHTVSLRMLSEMILKCIPAKIYIIGIQPKSVTIGDTMSREVQSAKEKLLELFQHIFSL